MPAIHGCEPQIDLGRVAVRQTLAQCSLSMRAHRRFERRVGVHFGPVEPAELPGHAERIDLRRRGCGSAAPAAHPALHSRARRRETPPAGDRATRRAPAAAGTRSLQQRALPLAQVRAHFENEVALRQALCAASSLSTSAAITPEPAPSSRMSPPLTVLAGPRTHWFARQRLNSGEISGAVTKSPSLPELGRAGAVVAEPGLVQRHLHEALEADPAAARIDLVADAMDQPAAVRGFVGRQLGGQFGRSSDATSQSSRDLHSSSVQRTCRTWTPTLWPAAPS